MSTKSWLLIQYPHQNALQPNSANEGYCAHYCRFTTPARYTTRRCHPANQYTLSGLNLKTYYWIWDWQEWLSVLSFISLPLVLQKHKMRERVRKRGRGKMGVGFKMTSGLQRQANARAWKIVCSFTAHRARGTTVHAAQLFNPVMSGGNYMYHQFNIQQFYVLPTQCIYVFCVDLRTNSDYFPIQH